MSNVKKLFAVIFAVMAVMLMNTAVWAATITGTGYTFNTTTGELTITGSFSGIGSNAGFAKTDIKTVKTTSGAKLLSFHLFYGASNCTSIDLSNAEFSTTDCSSMFRDCNSLKSITFPSTSGFTSQVTDMQQMFMGCSSLTSLDLSSFDTHNVTNMYWMFYDCGTLTSLDLNSFDTTKVTNMGGMFQDCYKLTEIKGLNKFNTSEVTNMKNMFCGCNSVTTLAISNFDGSNVTKMAYMFRDCSSLTTINLQNFSSSNLTGYTDIFKNCTNLREITLGANFSVSKSMSLPNHSGWIKHTSERIYNTEPYIGEIVSGTDEYAVINNTSTQCYAPICYEYDEETKTLSLLGDIVVADRINEFPKKSEVLIVTAKEGTVLKGNLGFMFEKYTACKSIDLSNAQTAYTYNGVAYPEYGTYITSIYDMFYGCSSLEEINLSGFYTNSCTDFWGAFTGCTSLKSLDISLFDLSKAEYKEEMFKDCTSLSELKIGSFSIDTDMCLPNKPNYWVNSNDTNSIVSGSGEYATITNSSKATFLRAYPQGDVNSDKKADDEDAAILLKYLSGIKSETDFTEDEFARAYVNNDKKIDMLDVITILNN